MNFAVYTLGCKVNQYESQAVSELMMSEGYGLVALADNPDIIFINSCSVTAESDRKTRQAVRKFRNKYKDSVIVLMGCMTSAHPELAENVPEADIVLGNKDYSALPAIVRQCVADRKKAVNIEQHLKGEKYNELPITDFSEHTRAFMKIEDGCDRFCTYCIIPYARGFVRSRDLADIKKEAESLAQNGYKEVVLVGINLSSFGKDNGLNLYDAVKAVADTEGIERVRLGSLEPDLMDDTLLQNLKTVDKFCPQFHLSLQSGCDATLKRMNRHYDTAFYYDLICRIRNIFDNAAITTDIMVGFAGETEKEFIESLEFVKKVGFAKSHIFAYSRRNGTVADRMSGHITNAEKAERSRKMIELTLDSEKEFLEAQCGRVANVLIETYKDGILSGYTENYSPVKIKGEEHLCGEIIKVLLSDVQENYIRGRIK